jgi:hypothetical protein
MMWCEVYRSQGLVTGLYNNSSAHALENRRVQQRACTCCSGASSKDRQNAAKQCANSPSVQLLLRARLLLLWLRCKWCATTKLCHELPS